MQFSFLQKRSQFLRTEDSFCVIFDLKNTIIMVIIDHDYGIINQPFLPLSLIPCPLPLIPYPFLAGKYIR